MTPRYPLYIVSKGRADSRKSSRMLEYQGVPYHIIVEESEADAYRAVIDPRKVLVLDPAYQRNYDTCDTLGNSKSYGPGPARNFAWDHSISQGATSHWVMDDNVRRLLRLIRNEKITMKCGTGWWAMEEFCDRYLNVGMAGPNYDYFAPRKTQVPPFILNTRIYSCNLIRNNLPFRWRGRYNEDTDLSLRILKAGWTTVQFYAFLQRKVSTQLMRGGNTDEFYKHEGTAPKSQMLYDMHPDCTKLVLRYGRHHHHVDYKRFATRLVRRPGVVIPDHADELGMVVHERA